MADSTPLHRLLRPNPGRLARPWSNPNHTRRLATLWETLADIGADAYPIPEIQNLLEAGADPMGIPDGDLQKVWESGGSEGMRLLGLMADWRDLTPLFNEQGEPHESV